jgi:hypothetical protein
LDNGLKSSGFILYWYLIKNDYVFQPVLSLAGVILQPQPITDLVKVLFDGGTQPRCIIFMGLYIYCDVLLITILYSVEPGYGDSADVAST